MCLLVVVSRLDCDAPLVVGANRDERLERPAVPATVLHDAAPRILGGRDEEAGGTWLAVNEHGVVAGLTNRPSPEGRDPARRSRGELPVALAMHRDAAAAVDDFVTRFSPADYNPAWLLVGDRTSLFAVDMTAGRRPVVEALARGVHILENSPLHELSPKADNVRTLLGAVSAVQGSETAHGAKTARNGNDLVTRLRSVLVDHSIPAPEEGAAPAGLREGSDHAAGASAGSEGPATRPAETLAACVHTEKYGTRSSTIVRVPAAESELPDVFVADGHPCTSSFVDVGTLWFEDRRR